jgi:hypothetical protein
LDLLKQPGTIVEDISIGLIALRRRDQKSSFHRSTSLQLRREIMNISDLNLPQLQHLKINRTESGRYVGETAQVKSVSISYSNGNPTECHFTVEVSSGAIIELPSEDVESAG